MASAFPALFRSVFVSSKVLLFRSRAMTAMSGGYGDRRASRTPPPSPGIPPNPRSSQNGVGFSGIVSIRPSLACTSAITLQLAYGSNAFGSVFGQELRAKSQEPSLANCQLLFASCYFVKDRSMHHFFALERIPHFTIFFAFVSSKNDGRMVEKTVEERPFRAVKRNLEKSPSLRRRPPRSVAERPEKTSRRRPSSLRPQAETVLSLRPQAETVLSLRP